MKELSVDEINFVRSISLKQLTEIRRDIVSVDYADKLAEHKNEQIEKMKNRCNCEYGRYSVTGRAFFACDKGLDKCEGCKEWRLSK